MRVECSRAWQIDALRDGRLGLHDAESFERHRRVCSACAAQLAASERLSELARTLARSGPTELELRRLRARVMRDTVAANIPQNTSARVRYRPVALAFVLTAVLLMVWSIGTRKGVRATLVASGGVGASTHRSNTAPSAAPLALSGAPTASVSPPTAGRGYAGSIIASPDAHWSQTRDALVERVHLDVGTLTVVVRPQEPDERFLVELPDGELEVRGTTFAVTVRGGATTHIGVDQGKVELRIAGRPMRTLMANDVWPTPPPATARRAAVSPSRVAPPPRVPPLTAVGMDAPRPRSAADDAARYGDAVELLRAGKYEDAANALHMVAGDRPQATQAEDASYLEAVALALAGRLDAAARVAEQYLDSFPESFHRKDAAILIARAARMRGDCRKARAALAPWRDALPEAEAQSVLRLCF